mmetsp:Transcript_10143/g.30594  ORF Transcript_10143/g.30594 Transcript_10143/m.30594 type:complete len:256 (+) Transcript_10143:650-1417(+)
MAAAATAAAPASQRRRAGAAPKIPTPRCTARSKRSCARWHRRRRSRRPSARSSRACAWQRVAHSQKARAAWTFGSLAALPMASRRGTPTSTSSSLASMRPVSAQGPTPSVIATASPAACASCPTRCASCGARTRRSPPWWPARASRSSSCARATMLPSTSASATAAPSTRRSTSLDRRAATLHSGHWWPPSGRTSSTSGSLTWRQAALAATACATWCWRTCRRSSRLAATSLTSASRCTPSCCATAPNLTTSATQ